MYVPKKSVLFDGLNGFWHTFFKDQKDLQAYYGASEVYLGQVYLDLLSSVLNLGLADTVILDKEQWKLFVITEDEVSYLYDADSEGVRFVFNLPENYAQFDTLQNVIIEPRIVLEKSVDFDTLYGVCGFRQDPFRGAEGPEPGIAWRIVQRRVGNKLTDSKLLNLDVPAIYDLGINRGDLIGILGTINPTIITSGYDGNISHEVDGYQFTGTDVGKDNDEGDLLVVTGHGGGEENDKFVQRYVIDDIIDNNTVYLSTETMDFPFDENTTPPSMAN
jgi:hypothetical protein